MCDLKAAMTVRDCAFDIYVEDHSTTKDDLKTSNVPFSWGVKRMYMDIVVMFGHISGVSRDDFGCFVGDSLPILDE